MTTIERLRAIIENKANELVLIDVATNLGYRFPRTVSSETWDDRENYDTFLRNLLALYEATQEPPIKGEHDPHTHAFRVNKGRQDARIFLKRGFGPVNTPEKLLRLLVDRGAIE